MDTDRARRASRQATSPRGSRACSRARWEVPRASRTAPGAPCRSCVPSQHLTGDDELMGLRGPLVDLRDLRVAEKALHLLLVRVAVAAVDLNGVGRHFHG